MQWGRNVCKRGGRTSVVRRSSGLVGRPEPWWRRLLLCEKRRIGPLWLRVQRLKARVIGAVAARMNACPDTNLTLCARSRVLLRFFLNAIRSAISAVQLLFILRGLRTFFQRLAIPDPAFAGVAGEFKILREFESVDGTGVFAEATEHAAA